MSFRAFYFIFFTCLLTSACSLRSGGFRVETLPPVVRDSAGIHLSQRIDEFVQSLAPQSFNGAVLVEKGGELILGNGYGYARYEQQLPFTTSTLSNTANFAQQLTAAAIFKLEASGKLRLQDSLSRFLPDLPVEKKEILLEQLLYHSSGLPQEVASLEVPVKKKEFIDAVARETLIFAPGMSYLYSEAGYRLLAAVVEAASGLPYEVFIQREILEPARMSYTGYVLPDFSSLTPAKEKGGDGSVKDLIKEYRAANGDLWHLMGSSGMLSTVEDVYRWERMLLQGKLLPAKYRNRIGAEQGNLPEGIGALGWALDEHSFNTPLLQHSSREGEFFTQLLYFPEEELSVVLFANQFNGQVEQLGMQIARTVLLPNYIPSPLPYADVKFVRVPQGEEARYARSLLSFIQGNEGISPRAIVDSVYNSDFKANETDQTHLNALTKLRERLGNAYLEKAQQAWPQFMFTFFEPEASAWYLLRLNVEQQAPYRITGIGLETVDALNARW